MPYRTVDPIVARITFGITKEIYDAIEKEVKMTGLRQSQVIRLWLKREMRRKKK